MFQKKKIFITRDYIQFYHGNLCITFYTEYTLHFINERYTAVELLQHICDNDIYKDGWVDATFLKEHFLINEPQKTFIKTLHC
jgi:hypothetical protein